LQVRTPTESAELSIPFVGEERVQSALAVIAVLSALGVSVRDVAETFMTLDLPEGRGNSIVVNNVLIIDDSYNANPVSMQMAIRHLSLYKRPGKKYALLGEILELGDEGIAAHRDIGSQVSMIDSVLSFGEGFAPVEFNAGTHHHYDDVSGLDLKMFTKNLEPGDTVLVKGSNKVFWKNNFVQMLVDTIS
jgi:UDP-N-acetylmuramoyl-tripeptide--D-alanyl-D-alanine ligase